MVGMEIDIVFFKKAKRSDMVRSSDPRSTFEANRIT